MTELVLLVEPDGPSVRVRAWELREGVHEIIEQCDIGIEKPWVRIWRCTNGERALSGQRIFREVLPPVVEEKENPIFQETVIKKPLPLTCKDS